MAEEILLNYSLSKDEISWNQEDQAIICRVDIEPAEEYRQNHQIVPCDICLVLDASASMDEPFAHGMRETKRQGVMAAAEQIVHQLSPQDTLSLIFYDSRAYEILPFKSADQKQFIQERIRTLSSYSGNTNFEAALTKTYNLLQKGQSSSKRIIFLTDGQANEGRQDVVDSTISKLVAEQVSMDCLGVGANFNFQYMRQFSGPSNGRTYLLSTPQEAGQRFEELLQTAQKAIASNVFLTAYFEPGLRDIEAYQWHPEMRYYQNIEHSPDGRSRLEINVQTLQQDKRNIYFFKANVDPKPEEPVIPMAQLRLDYDLPPAGKTGLRQQTNVNINATDGSSPPEPDSDVENSFYEVELAKFYDQLTDIMDKDWRQAANILQHMIHRCQNIGDKQREAHYQELLNKLQKQHNLSQDDLNRLGSSSSQSTQHAEIQSTQDVPY